MTSFPLLKNKHTFFLKLLYCLLLLSCSRSLIAQETGKGMISGTVVDRHTQKGIAFASVSIAEKSDALSITGCLTDSSGWFMIDKIKEHDYYLNITGLAYQKKCVLVHFEPNSHHLDVGKIEMDIESKVLNEIVIDDERKSIQLKSDRKIINVENSTASSGGSAIDVLQILPEFKAEQGNVRLKNQKFTVLINGKPSGITPEQLSQFPASSIDLIEVITNPSVKYNPQGLGGIVNLKLKKSAKGINSVVQASAGSDNCYNAAFTMNVREGKFNFFASTNGNFYGGKSDGYLNREIYHQSYLNESYQKQQGFLRSNLKIGFDLDLDSTNLFTFYWFQPNDRGHFENKINSVENKGQNSTTYDADIRSNTRFQQNQLSLSYHHLFPQKKAKFSMDIMQAFENSDNDYHPYTEYRQPVSAKNEYILSPKTDGRSTDIQCSLLLPVRSKLNLESGLNASYLEKSNVNSGETYNFEHQVWMDSVSIKNTFRNKQLVTGAYLLLTTSLQKVNFQLGARCEYTATNSLLENLNLTNQNGYFNFFPSANIGYTVNDHLDLSFSYSRRIERPESFLLNPFIYAGDYLSEKYKGNPDLKPAFTNSFEFNLSHNWDKFSFNATASYMQSSDVIDKIFYITDNVSLKTWSNINRVNDYMINSSINWKPSKYLRFDLSGNFEREEMKKADTDITYYNCDFRFSGRYTLNKDFIVNATMLYYAPSHYFSSTTDGQCRISVSLKKNITEKFILSVKLNNLLNSKYISYNWSDAYTSKSYTDSHYRAIYIGVMYKFGKEIKTRARLNINEIKMQRD